MNTRALNLSEESIGILQMKRALLLAHFLLQYDLWECIEKELDCDDDFKSAFDFCFLRCTDVTDEWTAAYIDIRYKEEVEAPYWRHFRGQPSTDFLAEE